jgi:hypothetical protein
MADTPAPNPPTSKLFTRVSRAKEPRVCQGDVFRDIEYIEYVAEAGQKLKMSSIVFPFVVVLTQDCDLEQDDTVRTVGAESDHDKQLISALVAPLYNYAHVREGTHLRDLGMTMQKIVSKKAPYVHNNEIARYHYLEFDPTHVQLPPSVIDFKHYFSVNVSYLKERIGTNWVCKIAELHREAFCHRFAAFLARIGLPNAAQA